MPESTEPLRERVRAAEAGLTRLLAEAEEAWAARADAMANTPGWRPFEDAFPTFYQFTNRPR